MSDIATKIDSLSNRGRLYLEYEYEDGDGGTHDLLFQSAPNQEVYSQLIAMFAEGREIPDPAKVIKFVNSCLVHPTVPEFKKFCDQDYELVWKLFPLVQKLTSDQQEQLNSRRKKA